ncbi:hypothetical protein JOD54_003684 [Actinokineospora baliensis]|uniref:TRAFAC clade GTPase domain-containing protein n=1 Tax=Actinokineospora baliensis TaxID=547056 RepID=UPI00195ED501|nr:hypothetical protein [Actinokineospora baliensis]MBM7773480.1 hypothetical protein [Actinokineospora baliensis]
MRTLSFRVAVTGLPQVGKTVFSVLLLDVLMNERRPGIEFTAESRSAISVYRAIRNIPAGLWPKSTVRGVVSTYSGKIEAKRTVVDLEIGDSAGEHWMELEPNSDNDPGYLEYVLSAHAVAHVIPLGDLLKPDARERVAADVEDLKLVARLRRQAAGSSARMPLLIILSKADLVIALPELQRPEVGLFQIDEHPAVPALTTVGRGYPQAVEILEKVVEQLRTEYASVSFTVTSAPAIVENRLSVGDRGAGLVDWVMRNAETAAKRG